VKFWLTLVVCCAALALPAGAAAITCAPPGVSGVSQYVETIPGSSCNHPSSGAGSGTGGHGGSLPAGTSKALAKQGGAGQAVAALVASSGTTGSTGPAGSTGSTAKSGSSKSSGSPGTASGAGARISGSGRGPLSAILHPILTGSSTGGAGVLLPVFLIAALVLVMAVTVVRRRLTPPGPRT
jgi:hypothetical protein